MAVTRLAPVRARSFVRLKLRIMANTFHGRTWRIVIFIFGLLTGLVMAALGFAALAATALLPPPAGLAVTVLVGSVVVVGWLLAPLLFFGVDETLDPALFALLPIRPVVLARGMLVAGLVSVPTAATALALAGLAVAAAIRDGALPGAVAALGVVEVMALCLVGSRAVTSAFAAMLRSRRVRDLAAVIIAVLASSIGPVQWLLPAALQRGGFGPALAVARVLGWTPLGAGYVAPFDVAAGRPLLAAARLALVLASIGALLWWWSRTLESAMTGVASNGPTRTRRRTGAGPVESLLPRTMPRGRPGPAAAVASREVRYWWRDPRRRANLISMTMASLVVLVASRLAGTGPGPPVPFTVGVAFSGAVSGQLLANQFGFDGTGYAAHLLTGVRGRVELTARAGALLATIGPILMGACGVVLLTTGGAVQLPAVLGTLCAALGVAAGVACVISVRVAYALPENANPFATSAGGASAKGLVALAGMAGSMLLCAPVTAAALLVPYPWSVVILPLGTGYGVAAVAAGTRLGGVRLDRCGPELLTAVTPRR